jgi:hypothetical protein
VYLDGPDNKISEWILSMMMAVILAAGRKEKDKLFREQAAKSEKKMGKVQIGGFGALSVSLMELLFLKSFNVLSIFIQI